MVLLLLFALAAAPLFLQAQTIAHPELTGTVWDTVSGRPITRGAVILNDAATVLLGRFGEFDFAQIPDTGSLRLRVQCRTRSIFAEILLERELRRDQDLSRLELGVDGRSCDLRPRYEITGVFVGHWKAGFEMSEFTQCGTGASAWLNFTPGVADTVSWPDGGDPYYPRYFVRVRGTLEGPGHHGHFGMSSHVLTVTEVLEARNPRRRDCAP